MVGNLLPKHPEEQCQRQHSRQCMEEPRTQLIEPKQGETCGRDKVLQRRTHRTKIAVQRLTIGAAHQVATIPTNDIPLLDQVPGVGKDQRFIMPQGDIIEINQAQVGSNDKDP